MSVFRSSLPPTRRRGKASVLEPHANELLELYQGFSLREIQQILSEKYEITLSLTSIHRFILRRLEPASNESGAAIKDTAVSSTSLKENMELEQQNHQPGSDGGEYKSPSEEKGQREAFSRQYTEGKKKPLV